MQKGRVRIGAVVAVAAAAAAVAWAVLGDDDARDPGQPRAGARAVDVQELRDVAASRQERLYWLGPRPGTTLELTTTPEGAVFVRYLPAGRLPGDERSALTVATYPVVDAFAALERAAAEADSVSTRVGKGLAVYDAAKPRNVYLAFPGSDRQIEVFAPTAREARDAVFGGRVRAIPRPARVRTAAAAELGRLPAAVGHAVYWAGEQEGATYELTRSSRGVVVRYLPPGVALGDDDGHLTVATYPIADAEAALRRAAEAEGAALRDLSGGGLLLTSEAHPGNAYVVFPGAAVQVEVFDPEPGAAARLVEGGRLVPLG